MIRSDATKVSYDTDQAIVSIGVTPFYRLGPENWFDDYVIISYLPWQVAGKNLARNISLREINPDLRISPASTNSILATKEYKSIIAENGLSDHHTITYKPLSSGDEFNFTETYENKAWIRNKYKTSLPFPRFITAKLADLLRDPVKAFGKAREGCGANGLVVQHEQLSGGRGTFFAAGLEGFVEVINALRDYPGVTTADDVVISERIKGEELSVQACITRSGTLIGPMQRQITRNPLLVNVDSQTANQFCGGMVSDEGLFGAKMREKVVDIINKISNDLRQEGFKGIFGVDFLASRGQLESLSIIEVNARMTSMLPLLTQIQKDYPFLLLHILEQIGAEYLLPDDINYAQPESLPDSAYVIVHDTHGAEQLIESGYTSGSYSGSFERLRDDLYLADDAYVLHNYTTKGQRVGANERLGAVFRQSSIDFGHPLGGIEDEFIREFKHSLHS